MSDIIFYGLLAVVVIVLIFAMLAALKAWRKANRKRDRGGRIAVVEALQVDDDRELLLVRRDGVEHLLLIGGDNDLLVESGIEGGMEAAEMTPRAPAAPPRRPIPPPPAEPEPEFEEEDGGFYPTREVEPAPYAPPRPPEPRVPPAPPIPPRRNEPEY